MEKSEKIIIPLHHILEELTGISKIKTKEDLEKLIKALKEMPNFEIDFSKLRSQSIKGDQIK